MVDPVEKVGLPTGAPAAAPAWRSGRCGGLQNRAVSRRRLQPPGPPCQRLLATREEPPAARGLPRSARWRCHGTPSATRPCFSASARPGALPRGTAASVLGRPPFAKVPLRPLLPGGALPALAADAPERLVRVRRCWMDSPNRYLGRPAPGDVRARHPDGTLGVTLDAVPPTSAGWGGDTFDAAHGLGRAWPGA